MPRLTSDSYLQTIRRESARFRDVLAGADPEARVPACPEWTAADLLWHLGEVQHFWGRIVTGRPVGPDEFEEPARPESYDALLAFFDERSAALAGALEAADPGEPAWTWSTEQTVGFVYRRQAHEALIHRLDAEQAAGQVTPLDPTTAADGVDEALDVVFGGCPPWGTFASYGHHLAVDVTDTGDSILVALGRFTGTDPDTGVDHDEDDISVVDTVEGEPDAVIHGPAAALDAWLWRRGDDSEVHVTGDRGVYGRFRIAVDNPLA